jgi:hypothetical protein
MAGLDPAIQRNSQRALIVILDGRVEPGHDDRAALATMKESGG